MFTLQNTSVTQFVTPHGEGEGVDFKGLADKALNKMKKINRNDNGQGNRALRIFFLFSSSRENYVVPFAHMMSCS